MPTSAVSDDVLLALFNRKDRSKLPLTTRKPTVQRINSTPTRQIKASSASPPVKTTSRTNGSPHANGNIRPSSTPVSRQSSSELRSIKQVKSQRVKRPSPVASTPQFTDSDDDEDEDESDVRRKRARLLRSVNPDPNRKIRDTKAFSDDRTRDSKLIHAMKIANSEKQEHDRFQYTAHFTALKDTEDDSPTVRLRYPSGYEMERYQIVQPTDKTDFKPMDEITENMKMVAEFYLDEKTANKITCPEDGSGIVERLERYAKYGTRGRVGAQSDYVGVIKEYNSLLKSRLEDGTVAKYLDEMTHIPIKLVKYIVKDQIYSRTVSPNIKLVTQYEGWSDNVYGELLPKFLNQIFQDTKLTSQKVFVDLGSGVGNCVIQAALQTGCEAWGCEIMINCARLAEAQASELVARSKLWGIKPGKVRLIHDSFLENVELSKALKRADVVLINNQAFTPATNDALKTIFLDLKEGCQIVSLKPFRHPHHKIKETNVNDPINVLRVVEKQRFSDMVSWADKDGDWYIQTVDRTELKAFIKSMEGS